VRLRELLSADSEKAGVHVHELRHHHLLDDRPVRTAFLDPSLGARGAAVIGRTTERQEVETASVE
jgi:hypothetical protein